MVKSRLFSRRIPIMHACWLALAMVAVVHAADKPAEPVKTREVKIKDIFLTVPESWQQQKPSNRLRLAQFAIPAVKGDKSGVQLVVFSFGGSSIQANVDRWKAQFRRDGRKVKVTEGKSPQGKYVIVDLSGTYNQPVGPPFMRKTKLLPDARMLAVILIVKGKGVYYLKMAGGGKTVTSAAKLFRASFGGDAEKEKEFKADN